MNNQYTVVNIPDPHNEGERIVGYRIPKGSEAYGEYGLSEPVSWFHKQLNAGIRNHDGQKLLIQHILDDDKTMNGTTRDILEQLIGVHLNDRV